MVVNLVKAFVASAYVDDATGFNIERNLDLGVREHKVMLNSISQSKLRDIININKRKMAS
jgi:hypothetical protein